MEIDKYSIDEELVIHIDVEMMRRLRELCLWYWDQMTVNRAFAKSKIYRPTAIKNYNKKADIHIKFVQTLNDFFPIDDTVKMDHAQTKS